MAMTVVIEVFAAGKPVTAGCCFKTDFEPFYWPIVTWLRSSQDLHD